MEKTIINGVKWTGRRTQWTNKQKTKYGCNFKLQKNIKKENIGKTWRNSQKEWENSKVKSINKGAQETKMILPKLIL